MDDAAMLIMPIRECEGAQSEMIERMWKQWGNPSNYDFYEYAIKNSVDALEIPHLFCGCINGKLIGFGALIRTELGSRQDLTPWLTALYIKEAFRNMGFGKQLQLYAMQQAKQMGYPALYLSTGLNGYYERTGWGFVENGIEADGSLHRIYRIPL